MASYKFQADKLGIEFVEQENAERVALGEQFEKVIFTPANSTGHIKSFHFSKLPNDARGYQIARSGWKTCKDAALAGYPASKTRHFYTRPDELENGRCGWMHRDLLGDKAIVQIGKIQVENAFVINPDTHLREYGSRYEWLQLFEIGKNWYAASQDNTFTKNKYGVTLPLPWGSLRHTHLADLAAGTQMITYPMLDKVFNDDGTFWWDTKEQDEAKFLFATMMAIKKGELTLEKAREQEATHNDEMRHNYWDLEAGIKSGEITPADVQETKENAVRHVTGQAVVPTGIIVAYLDLDGVRKETDLAELPSGRYQCSIVGDPFVRTYPSDQAGRLNIRKLVRQNNGNLKVEKVS